jgi:fructokinase
MVISFGEALVDRFPQYLKMGGAPCNVAYNLTQLGTDARLISAVGSDDVGAFIRMELERIGVAADFVQTNALPSGVVNVTFSGSEAQYEIAQPAAWDAIAPDESLLALAQSCDAFCFSTLVQRDLRSRETLYDLLDATKPGCLKVFDVNLRPPFFSLGILEQSLRRADVVKVNEHEAQEIGALFSEPEITGMLFREFGVKEVVLTLGKRGAMLLSPEREAFYPAATVDTSEGDSVGVGDAFLSAFIHHRLKGTPDLLLMQAANRFAGFVATQKGAVTSFDPAFLDDVR